MLKKVSVKFFEACSFKFPRFIDFFVCMHRISSTMLTAIDKLPFSFRDLFDFGKKNFELQLHVKKLQKIPI